MTTGALANGGASVARHEGRAVFVRGALPGETARIRVSKDKGSYWEAEAVEILEPSPLRVPSLCPIAGAGAGCCDLAFLDPTAARALKGQVVSEQLARLGKVQWEGEAQPLGAVSGTGGIAVGGPTGWRTRVQLDVDAQGRAGFHRHQSAELVAELACAQPVPGALDGLADQRFPPGSELAVVVDDDGVRHVEQTDPAKKGQQGKRTRTIQGGGVATQRVGDREWKLPLSAFWQSHRDAARTYSVLLAEWVGSAPGATAWDLYGGAGVFAAVLAETVGPTGHVFTVDSSRQASQTARRALRDLPRVHARAGLVHQVVAQLPAADLVVLDPPRAGAGRTVVEAVSGARRIVHIGCEVAAFSRDVGLYVEHGYQVREIRVFDAFPLTHHVECFALLDRM